MHRLAQLQLTLTIAERELDLGRAHCRDLATQLRHFVHEGRHEVAEVLGGVRSACTYVGARKLRELTKRTTFVRVAAHANEAFDRG